MNYNCGSVWRRWDFHVHTPFSILNNEYGFNPYEVSADELAEKFDEYVKTLFIKALECGVCAIGSKRLIGRI